MGAVDLFSQDLRADVNLHALKYLNAFSKLLKDEPSEEPCRVRFVQLAVPCDGERQRYGLGGEVANVRFGWYGYFGEGDGQHYVINVFKEKHRGSLAISKCIV